MQYEQRSVLAVTWSEYVSYFKIIKRSQITPQWLHRLTALAPFWSPPPPPLRVFPILSGVSSLCSIYTTIASAFFPTPSHTQAICLRSKHSLTHICAILITDTHNHPEGHVHSTNPCSRTHSHMPCVNVRLRLELQ